ncbi:DNA end-binding protein Ku [Streptomyces sp. 2333.5]|uniref:non-homologous end joining protein Ku n=1 Tax=Streptomyces TaxID=1883 RepID=UPI000897B7F2|nr:MULTISPECIES: Ku protein [unclassified Streptomyces]PJJ06087.1 DNA end-binding protein Ku [Streptomyces sp. 2333.5]SEE89956.1 DNA end-binding protein Ku [Streptomyces sp. 2314.4]SEF06689.1 DNA end-binding protein Ku [Streptomyces sp. 2112.2]
MRSIWNGSISFGLVTIPVKTYSATDRTSSVSFVRIHEKDGAPVQYRKICELDGNEVPNEEVGKGYQPPGDDTIVPITDDDLSRLPMPTAKTLSILSFVDPTEIDPLQMDKSYYLAPNGASAAKPYTLLREALEHHRKVAIGKVAMRGRESLAMLRAHDGALVMHQLLWPDQIRPATEVVPDDVEIRENEMTLAETLMDSLGELDPAELHDDYREAVEELVAAKLEGEEPVAPAAAASGAQVIDLTAALEKSVRAAQGGDTGTEAEPASVTPLRGRKAAKKSAAKSAAKKSGTTQQATARKTGAAGTKKAPAKKTAAKKSATAPKAAGGRTKAASATGKSTASRGTAAASSGKSASKSTAKKTAAKKTTAKKTGKRSSA